MLAVALVRRKSESASGDTESGAAAAGSVSVDKNFAGGIAPTEKIG